MRNSKSLRDPGSSLEFASPSTDLTGGTAENIFEEESIMQPNNPEDTVRAFFQAFTESKPELLASIISADYIDYGHNPAGRGVEGALADYNNSMNRYGLIVYAIDALVASGETVSTMWTGTLVDGNTFRGLSLYRVVAGRILETRNAVAGDLPTPPVR